MGQEIWRPVVGFEALYEVSSLGRVKSLKRRGTSGGLLVGSVNPDTGYLQVCLWRGNRQHGRRVHTLVLEAFVGPKPSPELECRHLDGDKMNLAVENLAWGTSSENACDTVRHGRGRRFVGDTTRYA